ncbi:hypothetical protein Drose_20725 [Dactylosporangium roseum]|uniref:Uncharacterized protein n=1 Tax=Dactylosporangium roseum TaxID=47989 RepID=A0ABY5YVF1_9ACTN|nr:hypothetical protein [Dactylosporangium roseum]UWZ33716.1 hypothetical protein Drose_20725 [Dactylosporangium roseum]
MIRLFRGRRRPPRITADEAERLLDTTSTDPGLEHLAGLLRSAAGPARPRELAGEGAALAAFRQRHLPAGAVSAGPRRRLRLGALAGSVTAALLIAGTGTAAGSGRLPEPLQRAAHDWLSGVGVPDANPPASPPGQASSRTGVAPAAPTPAGRPASSTTVSPARLDELCRAWQPGRGKQLTDAQRRELAALAQGEERIEAFCKGKSQGPPGQSDGQPNGQSDDQPDDQPDGKSNGRPGGPAASAPAVEKDDKKPDKSPRSNK